MKYNFSLYPIYLEFGLPNWSFQVLQIENVNNAYSLLGIAYCIDLLEIDLLFINFKVKL